MNKESAEMVITAPAVSASSCLDVRLPGNVRYHGEEARLTVVPRFGLRVDCDEPAARRFGIFRVSLKNPKSTSETVRKELQRYEGQHVTDFNLSIEAKATHADLLDPQLKKHSVTLRITIEFEKGVYSSSPLAACVRLDKAATKQVSKSFGEGVYAVSLLWADISCFNWWGMVWGWPPFFFTTCFGSCLPFFTCKCFQILAGAFAGVCQFWVDCDCLLPSPIPFLGAFFRRIFGSR